MINDDVFKKLLKKNLPWLRRTILNLDDYILREDYDELLERQKDFDNLRRVNNQQKFCPATEIFCRRSTTP